MLSNITLEETEHEVAAKAAIQTHFAQINQFPGETGTCKKMLPLALLNQQWQHLAVVFSKTATPQACALLHKERLCLQYLADNDYPVVKVFGEAFLVEREAERYAMLMDYINGIFIEAKTPAPLKALILACLLDIPAEPQKEVWLARNLAQLKQDIAQKIVLNEHFGRCQEKAKNLNHQFKALIQRLYEREEMIVDLQMIITSQAEIVLIDPLDIVNRKTRISVLKQYEAMEEAKDLNNFLVESKIWLNTAQRFCEAIVNATNPNDVITLMLQQEKPLLLSQGCDLKHKSRLNQLKYGISSKSQGPGQSINNSTKL